MSEERTPLTELNALLAMLPGADMALASDVLDALQARGWVPPWEVSTTTEWALRWGDDGPEMRWRVCDEETARRKAHPGFGDQIGTRVRRTVQPTPWVVVEP